MSDRWFYKGNSTLYFRWRKKTVPSPPSQLCQELNARLIPFFSTESHSNPLFKERCNSNIDHCHCARKSTFLQTPDKLLRDASCIIKQKRCRYTSSSVHWRNFNRSLCKTMDYWFKIGFQVTNHFTGYAQVHFIVILYWLIVGHTEPPCFAQGTSAGLGSKIRPFVP